MDHKACPLVSRDDSQRALGVVDLSDCRAVSAILIDLKEQMKEHAGRFVLHSV